MQTQLSACRLVGACAVLSVIVAASPVSALQLISVSEAALPTAQIRGQLRGITRGPTVVIISPSPAAGFIHAPLDLKIKFETYGDAKIDTNSVLLTYMKIPAIDLTQRITSYIGTTGIDVKDAEVPPGTHTLRLDVTDTAGHSTWVEFTFTVSQ
jgi:hypothetical protein